MKICGKSRLASGFLVLASPALFAQLPQVPIQPVESSVQATTIFGNQSTTEVTGAPFSAIEESLYCEKEPDGTCKGLSSITTHFYRDGQGRTRAERSVAPYVDGKAEVSSLRSLIITDPPAGTITYLDADNHKAIREPRDKNTQAVPGRANMAKSVTPPEELQSHTTTELLGTATMEGIDVEGSRQTLDVPASAAGNDQPIHIVVETWVSPELKVAVLTKRDNFDRRTRTTRLTHVDRSEPDPALFQIPPDYKIEDRPATAPTIMIIAIP